MPLGIRFLNDVARGGPRAQSPDPRRHHASRPHAESGRIPKQMAFLCRARPNSHNGLARPQLESSWGLLGQLWGLLAGAENSRSVLFEPGYGLLGLSRGAPGLYCEFFRPPLRRHGALLQLSWGPIGASTGLGRVLKTDRKDGRGADGAWSQA